MITRIIKTPITLGPSVKFELTEASKQFIQKLLAAQLGKRFF